MTVWNLKIILGGIVNQKPEHIDIIKYTDPLPDTSNCKGLNELMFYDKENIKVAKKTEKFIARGNLLNEEKTEVSPKFKKVIETWFN